MQRKNGCYDRKPFFAERQAQDGWDNLTIGEHNTRVPKMVIIPHVNSMDCQHDSANDLACEGCKHQK